MKILLALDNLKIGGIATSFYNFINEIEHYDVECDVLVFDDTTIDKNRIPNRINVLETNKNLQLLAKEQSEFWEISRLQYFKRVFYVILSKAFSGNFSRKILYRRMDIIGEYDLAIAYCHDLGWNSFTPGCRQFVAERVRAIKKAVYIHCDYDRFGGMDKRQEQDYSSFDYILCVSYGCQKSFVSAFPMLEKKTFVLENFTDCDDVLRKARNAIEYDRNKITFVSVCRLSEEKAILRTISVLAKLVSEGVGGFEWFIVGDGPLKTNIQKKIQKYNMGYCMHLLGQQENPYKYIKNANAVLLLSYHEAAPMVFGECQTLGVPIVSTDTISAEELVEDRKIGIVCPNDDEGVYVVLKNILQGQINLKKLTIDSTSVNVFARNQLRNLLEHI